MLTFHHHSAADAAVIFLSILPLIASQPPVYAPAPAPAGPDCTDYLFNMIDCLDYASNGSTAKLPSPACCSEVSDLLINHPACLCQLLNTNSTAASDFNIDPARASRIPNLCRLGVSYPPSSPSPAAPAPAPASCDDALYNLADCLDFVTDPTVKRPSPVCCSEVAGLLGTQPTCVCSLINNSSSLGFDIDTARAAQLARLCNIGTAAPSPAPTPMEPPPPGPTTVAPAPAPTCMDYVFGLADCLDFVEGDSSVTEPSSDCCSEVTALVNTKPVCLCKLINNSTDFGIVNFDVARAVEMPKLCKLDTPPIQACSLLGVPIDPTKYPPAEGPSVPTPPSNGGAARLHFKGLALISVLLTFFI